MVVGIFLYRILIVECSKVSLHRTGCNLCSKSISGKIRRNHPLHVILVTLKKFENLIVHRIIEHTECVLGNLIVRPELECKVDRARSRKLHFHSSIEKLRFPYTEMLALESSGPVVIHRT